MNEKPLVSLMYVLYSYESILEIFLCMLIDGKILHLKHAQTTCLLKPHVTGTTATARWTRLLN